MDCIGKAVRPKLILKEIIAVDRIVVWYIWSGLVWNQLDKMDKVFQSFVDHQTETETITKQVKLVSW